MELFGKEYDPKEIEHVCQPFFETALLLRDTTDFLNQCVSRYHEGNATSHRGTVRRYHRCLALDRPNVCNSEHIQRRLAGALSAVGNRYSVLYAAEYGPLYKPSGVFATAIRDNFSDLIDRLRDLLEPVLSRLPAEWEPNNYEAWDSLKRRDRASKMQFAFNHARPAVHDSLLMRNDQCYQVDILWRQAQKATQ